MNGETVGRAICLDWQLSLEFGTRESWQAIRLKLSGIDEFTKYVFMEWAEAAELHDDIFMLMMVAKYHARQAAKGEKDARLAQPYDRRADPGATT